MCRGIFFQDKLESQSESEQIELYEEKLKLTEAELLCCQQRAEIAESQGTRYQSRTNSNGFEILQY